jgi:predicted lipoprotein
MTRAGPVACLLFALAVGGSGCKIVRTDELAARAAAAAKPTAAANAAGLWASKVVPYIEEKAAPFPEVQAAAKADLKAAGAKYGYREAGEGAPWNFVARVSGTVTAANTASRAATADVDTNGDGAPDVTVQLGPVIKGTSIRDALPFVSFTQVRNQIEFADVAKSFNTSAYDTALKALPRDRLVGAKLDAAGVFTLRSASDKALLTPVTVRLEGPQS